MAKCCAEDAAAAIKAMGHVSNSGGRSFRLWTPSFRKRLFEVVACGGAGDGSGRRSAWRRGGGSWRREAEAGGGERMVGGDGNESGSGREGRRRAGSENKLSDFLNVKCTTAASEDRRSRPKEAEEMKRVVAMLGEHDKAAEAASKVRRLAKDDASARSLLAMLGAIPPLVGMIDCESDGTGDDEDDRKIIAALYALLNLAIGNDLNKAAIVEAGAVHKMLNLVEGPNGCLRSAVSEAIVANFLGLSALDSNKDIIGSSGAIPLLVKLLECKGEDGGSTAQSRQDSLRALYNLTISHSNISFVLETDLVAYLMSVMGDMEVSERGLAILSNVVSSPEGRKAISAIPDTFHILVDILNWTDALGCQEKATYILMVMSHKAYGDRRAMVEAGVVSALLELTLIGSTLAQKRASRILEILRVDKGKQISQSFSNVNISAPLYGPCSSTEHSDQDNGTEDTTSVEKKAVKQLVQQSLQNNMRRIVKRANLPNDYVPSDHFKSLTLSSTSKSLPF
uniref:U-box domain-containing protein n=1 Tax=Kalanchoe fedtschenkoi TaxID=63787 RepID=A0A7N0ZSZ2_KALFE